jgi:hypothetical protein
MSFLFSIFTSKFGCAIFKWYIVIKVLLELIFNDCIDHIVYTYLFVHMYVVHVYISNILKYYEKYIKVYYILSKCLVVILMYYK